MPDRVQYGPLPFEEQLAFFRRKLNLPAEEWDDLVRQQHDWAFTVAGVTAADLLQDLRGAVDRALVEGRSVQWFEQAFARIVADAGWLQDREGVYLAWRAEVVLMTNARTAYAAGRRAQQKAPAVAEARPWWRYEHGGSSDPRPRHFSRPPRGFNGLVLRHDDPWWGAHYPPNGFGCSCVVDTLSGDDVEALKAAPDFYNRPPPERLVAHVDRRTGERRLVPAGVQPGFDYAPGASPERERRFLLRTALGRLPEPLRSEASRYVRRQTGERVAPADVPGWGSVETDEAERAAYRAGAGAGADERATTLPAYLAEYDGRRSAREGLPAEAEELAALKWYTDDGYRSMNAELARRRGELRALATEAGTGISALAQRALADARMAAAALRRLPAYEGTVYRGAGGLSAEEAAAAARRYRVGERVTEPAFVSASDDPSGQFAGRLRFVIESRTGRRVSAHSEYGHEREVLFAPGAEFDVLAVDRQPGGAVVVYLEER